MFRNSLVALLIVALGIAGWGLRETALAQWLLRQAASVGSAPAAEPAPARPAMAPTNKAVAGLHKCRVGSAVTYTDRPCPAGSRNESVVEGPVTVLPAPAVPAPVPSHLPNVRDLALDGSEQALRERRAEQAIGR